MAAIKGLHQNVRKPLVTYDRMFGYFRVVAMRGGMELNEAMEAIWHTMLVAAALAMQSLSASVTDVVFMICLPICVPHDAARRLFRG